MELVDLKQKDVWVSQFCSPCAQTQCELFTTVNVKTLHTFTGRQNKLTEEKFLLNTQIYLTQKILTYD